MGGTPSIQDIGNTIGNGIVDAGNTAGNFIVDTGNTAVGAVSNLIIKSHPPPRPRGTDWLPPPREDGPPETPPPQPDITNILRNITDQFNGFLIEKSIYANNQITQVNNAFGLLSTNTLADVSNLVQDIRNENISIQNQIDYNIPRINRSNIVTWFNQQPQVDSLKYQNYILYIVFYVLVLILGAIMFYMNNTSFMFQVIVFHVLLIYPFLIYYLELFLYIIYAWVYSYLYGVPYKSVYIGNMDIKLT
jgi:hypothetical protein